MDTRTTSATVATYRFGNFELQPGQRRLLQDGRAITLGPRAFDVLVALVERAGQLVTKDELIERVWPGVVVEENNLQVQVSTLRKILGADAIATTAGRGYCFTPEVLPSGGPSSPVTRRHNLPPQLTSFIGHAEDLDEYAALLGQARLLTLTGIGGCGKTRLAIELAGRVHPSFADGVWYVDLAPLLDADRVALTVATTLGIREESERPVVETLCARLAGQTALLVLDNCEHLVAACADLVQQLIGSAPSVRVLAASREGLGVPGERSVTVRSLAFPTIGTKLGSDSVAACEAVRLFVERAQWSNSDFELRDDNSDAVAEICRRLDGIPLAIELAAARVKMLSVTEIRARLDDRFRLLTGGSRAALGRQQTLLAAIQWSYDHLAFDQQQLLRRLAVFVGGWTLQGAVRVAGEPLDEYVVLDLLTGLADQSLVTIPGAEGGSTRYAMLESVRQYAHERLTEADEAGATRDRHCRYYVEMAETAGPKLLGPEQGSWFARLDVERENLLAAHAWCDQDETRAEHGLRLAYSLKVYFLNRGLVLLGNRVSVEALMRPGARDRNLPRCRALWAAGEICYLAGRYDESREYIEESLAIAREIGDAGCEAEALRGLGYLDVAHGQRAMARKKFEDALELCRRLPDKFQLAKTINGLASFMMDEGETDRAKQLWEEALLLMRDVEDRGAIAVTLSNFARLSLSLREVDRARAMLREGIALVDEYGLKRAGVDILENVAEMAALSEAWERAARWHRASEVLSEEMGLQQDPLDRARPTFVTRGRETIGETAFAAAESAGRSLSYEKAITEARSWLEQRC